jgi:hypothetical protein
VNDEALATSTGAIFRVAFGDQARPMRPIESALIGWACCSTRDERYARLDTPRPVLGRNAYLDRFFGLATESLLAVICARTVAASLANRNSFS